MTSFRITPVQSDDDLTAAIQLVGAYAASLGFDLGFQGFAAEVAGMPGKYAPPAGALLLARDGAGVALGCVALRPILAGCCEMKRLYVAPAGRGMGIGRALVDAIITEAGRIGYREIKLDTLPSMAGAIALYRQAGFTAIAPYCESPFADAVFLGLELTARA